jgi:hypothetical protein
MMMMSLSRLLFDDDCFADINDDYSYKTYFTHTVQQIRSWAGVTVLIVAVSLLKWSLGHLSTYVRT